MSINKITIGPLEFEREGTEMFINKLPLGYPPSGDGDHVATAEGIWDEVWHAFIVAAVNGFARTESS